MPSFEKGIPGEALVIGLWAYHIEKEHYYIPIIEIPRTPTKRGIPFDVIRAQVAY